MPTTNAELDKLKASTKEKRAYLKYYKKNGTKSLPYGQWKKMKQVNKAGGSIQMRKQMMGLSGSDYAEIMKMRNKKK